MRRRWLVRLYPAAWRARYGEEFLALLADRPLGPSLLIDVLAGAVDAWVAPQPMPAGVPGSTDAGGRIMGLLTRRCHSQTLTRSDRWRWSLTAAVGSVALSAFYVWMKPVWGESLYVQALGLALVPIMFIGAWVHLALRDFSWPARLIITAAAAMVAYLGGLLAAWT
jgi:hypothetical protein